MGFGQTETLYVIPMISALGSPLFEGKPVLHSMSQARLGCTAKLSLKKKKITSSH